MHSRRIGLSEEVFEANVDRILSARAGQLVLLECLRAAGYRVPLDYIDRLKARAAAAREAQEWFDPQRPTWASRLPLTSAECQELLLQRRDRLQLLVGYSRSLRQQDFDYRKHPVFHNYCCGLMALAPEGLGECELMVEFPPKELPGLDGIYWRPVPGYTAAG